MDKNQSIGLLLMLLLLMVYFYFFSSKPQPQPQPSSVPADTVISPESSPQADQVETVRDTLASDSLERSLQQQKLGPLYELTSGQETETSLENDLLEVKFSSKGASLTSVILKKFKDYQGEPLKLYSPESSDISQYITLASGQVDLSELYYQMERRNHQDTTILVFTAATEAGSIIHQYALPPNSYQVLYHLSLTGLDGLITSSTLSFQWENDIPRLESELKKSRDNTTINYYLASEDFENLDKTSEETEEVSVNEQIKWAGFKQLFFTSAIIQEGYFSGGNFITTIPADSSTVKHGSISLQLPMDAIKNQNAHMRFYFGPNNFSILKKVAPGFEKNVYLGYAVVSWVNKWIIIPIFHFLERFIDNYGIIIIIMVFFIKIALFPLSYKSYVSMAKMKVLKPELDELKEQHGEDQQKFASEQMKLFQKVGVSPLSGCVPLLLQMPILIAMFFFFPNSVELRQKSFLWANDLSTYDAVINLPFNIPVYGDHVSMFTLLMTVSTILYTWSNQQVSSVQGPMKTISYMMPLMFMVILNSYPAGLSFYYFVSNLVTFGQQTLIRRFVDDEKIKNILEENKRKNANKKKSPFQSRLEQALKASNEKARKKGNTKRKR